MELWQHTPWAVFTHKKFHTQKWRNEQVVKFKVGETERKMLCMWWFSDGLSRLATLYPMEIVVAIRNTVVILA